MSLRGGEGLVSQTFTKKAKCNVVSFFPLENLQYKIQEFFLVCFWPFGLFDIYFILFIYLLIYLYFGFAVIFPHFHHSWKIDWNKPKIGLSA